MLLPIKSKEAKNMQNNAILMTIYNTTNSIYSILEKLVTKKLFFLYSRDL